jgi:hypothetical protein
MTKLELDPARGVFEPAVSRSMAGAFEKAERYLDRQRGSILARICREGVARRIVAEFRTGETQPDLAWRAAIAKELLAARTEPSKGSSETAGAVYHFTHRRREALAVASDMPRAGPHAAPRHTNVDATPGAGALPSDQPGDEVDPATG